MVLLTRVRAREKHLISPQQKWRSVRLKAQAVTGEFRTEFLPREDLMVGKLRVGSGQAEDPHRIRWGPVPECGARNLSIIRAGQHSEGNCGPEARH